MIVRAEGELDAYAAPDLADALRGPVGKRHLRLVADLTRTTFMDSTALGVLVNAVRELERGGGRVRIVLPERSARRIFEITTLDRVLPVSSSCALALEELARPDDDPAPCSA